ncbi:nitric oxide synthase-interacting protein homolog isoform X2 [Aricia agestis]|uniref:nitric oxide synthase-interacting protein homolog isoform X1 n=1 Tax=Aricia agestis TaxID=91739 RepID=UPI001C202785|nr:nitric oxide synthase-interacting protein homolog isoform X1 [Aricia agestis]XP_041973244.1 nitric oxide synthase-interacting protein homolog isoform X1 [Aricia agestis]XP_041973245.1 nitric oxide synthase-interacting protein homolog isoform X2 [Aricia agestis]
MTRHARNCTAGAVYTYHEKRKDAAASGYGTQSERVGKDSVKSFDCCSLTLQPCRNPVVTKEGYLFDKESILEYVITKKNEYTRKLKQYEKQLKKEEEEKKELAAAEQEANLIKFMNREKNISNSKSDTTASTSSISNLANGKDKKLPSFWIPSELPDAKVSKIQKPDSTVYCPISGKPLKVKDLIEVKWTMLPDDPDEKKSLIAKENRYMCPVTHDILNNAVPCAVIRTTGHVVTMECVEKIIKKDWLHPLTGDKLKEKDIIPLQRGGTGYALTNQNLESKNERPVLQA